MSRLASTIGVRYPYSPTPSGFSPFLRRPLQNRRILANTGMQRSISNRFELTSFIRRHPEVSISIVIMVKVGW